MVLIAIMQLTLGIAPLSVGAHLSLERKGCRHRQSLSDSTPLTDNVTMDLDSHWRAYGKKKGIKKEKWETGKYAKYLESVKQAIDEVDEAEELAFDDMSAPRNMVKAEPKEPADTFSIDDQEHLAFRQINALTGKAEVKVVRPVIRKTISGNLFGTSGDNLELDLVEQ